MRYIGWYSNRVRARRAAAGAAAPVAQEQEPAQEIATRAKSSWARLIKKVYGVDPLECPRCKGPLRVIALINDAGVVQRILKHLGLWAPRQNERAPSEGGTGAPLGDVTPETDATPALDGAASDSRSVASRKREPCSLLAGAPPAGIEVALPADNVLSYHPAPDIA